MENNGGLAERSNAAVLKTALLGTVTGVRIPEPPQQIRSFRSDFFMIYKNSMESNDVISFTSPIDESYVVTVIYPESDYYSGIKSMLDQIGGSIAALIVGEKMILVDGQELEKIDIDQFKAVQAHEICHSILDHTSELSEEEEVEADLSAIHLLLELNEIKASESLSERLLSQRGIEYSNSSFGSLLSERSLRLYTDYLEGIRK